MEVSETTDAALGDGPSGSSRSEPRRCRSTSASSWGGVVPALHRAWPGQSCLGRRRERVRRLPDCWCSARRSSATPSPSSTRPSGPSSSEGITFTLFSPARGRCGRAHHRSSARVWRPCASPRAAPTPSPGVVLAARALTDQDLVLAWWVPRLARLVHRLDHAGPRGAEGRRGLDAGVPCRRPRPPASPLRTTSGARSRPWSWSCPVPRSPRPATSRHWSIWPTNTGPWPCSTR